MSMSQADLFSLTKNPTIQRLNPHLCQSSPRPEPPRPATPGRIVLLIAPMPAPRLNRKSRFNPKKRALFERYMTWKDRVRELARKMDFRPEDHDELHVEFILPMPKSWSRKKQQTMIHQPCKKKPDTDNLVKALKDALWKEDSHIWRESQEKRWGVEGKIILNLC